MKSFKTDLSSYTLRVATELDSDFVLALRNSREAVSYSPSRTRVAVSDHKGWFSDVLVSSSSYLFIGEERTTRSAPRRKVGMIRFDNLAHNNWIVSIAVAKEYRGMRLGAWLLNQGLSRLEEMNDSEPQTVTASVHEDNVPSMRLFHSEGFKENGREDRFLHLVKYLGGD